AGLRGIMHPSARGFLRGQGQPQRELLIEVEFRGRQLRDLPGGTELPDVMGQTDPGIGAVVAVLPARQPGLDPARPGADRVPTAELNVRCGSEVKSTSHPASAISPPKCVCTSVE